MVDTALLLENPIDYPATALATVTTAIGPSVNLWISSVSFDNHHSITMDADFSVELGHDDPVLDFPWNDLRVDPPGSLFYVDLKRHPECISQIEEAQRCPALAEFLFAMNSTRSMLQTAKCDVWMSAELSVEEEIYAASDKFASYVDFVFAEDGPDTMARRQSLPAHERFARKLVDLLGRAPTVPSSVEICIRRCFFTENAVTKQGLYFTFYISGYGASEADARQNWEIALKLVQNAVLQLSTAEFAQ